LLSFQSLAEAVLVALARAIETRDRAASEHAERVRKYAMALAGHAGIDDPLLLHTIQTAALLHDVGKLAIADRLLDKPGPLTFDEYDQVKQRATIGAEILSGVPFPSPLALLVRHHHENWDGTGYPDALRRDAIPLGARVLSIADCYDALTSGSSVSPRTVSDAAIAIIHERRRTMFDPQMTDPFLRIIWRLRPASANVRPWTRQHPRVSVPGPWPIEASAR
jgi:response regulator RpfG family c-di-GMP phosphodiesterase